MLCPLSECLTMVLDHVKVNKKAIRLVSLRPELLGKQTGTYLGNIFLTD